MTLRALVLVCCCAALGCVEFNSECTPPVPEPEFAVTTLAAPVPVTRSVVRTRETALGNAIADSYLRSFDNTSGSRPSVAIENAGAIRDQGLCITRTELKAGPLSRRVLRDTIPFSNELVVVQLTEEELFDILDHGVATIARPGVSPAGWFLSVAGMSYEVDCSAAPEELPAKAGDLRKPGQRVRSITFTDRGEVKREDASKETKITVAVSNFLADGNDDFVALGLKADALRTAGKEPWTATGRDTYTVFEKYLNERLSPKPVKLPLDPEKPRITLRNCN